MSEKVTQWLHGLGLDQLTELFVEQQIDYEVLADLTEEDLEKLVIPLGPRKKLLKAIANLAVVEPSCETPVAGSVTERRQLTVMFCDMVGSTALSQKLDPEDLRVVNLAYQQACKSAIERFDGYVARYMGDGVLAYFGFPQAHEDEAERAIHAGLGVVQAMESVNSTIGERNRITIDVRVGIATGAVVVGDLIGEGVSQQSAVIGATPNLASRLQELASPNTILVSAETHQLVGSRFHCEDFGLHVLKGFSDPVRAWRAICPTSAVSRFEAAHRAGLTPLVGREHEVGLLLERWEQTKQGDGQVVLLSGEPGIGKSRITEALRKRTLIDKPVELRYQCSPYHTYSTLNPVIDQLERTAGFDEEDTAAVKLEKIEALVSRSSSSPEVETPLIAALLSVPTASRYPLLTMPPERQKEATLQALVGQIFRQNETDPVLVLFEDAHWADPTTLELLELLVERSQSAPILIIITSRPEFYPAWTGHTHAILISLNRFTQIQATAMVEYVTGGKALPGALREQIVRQSDGVPLFVEELTKTILESGQLNEESDRFSLAGATTELSVPSTLRDSLMARLDHLTYGKQVAQAGAVIGRVFSRGLLDAVCGVEEEELEAALEELEATGLVFRRGSGAGEGFIFKHALVRDAAYESLLTSKRQQLHDLIAKSLHQQFPERVGAEPELVAHHLTEAGNTESAIEYWLTAGKHDVERSSNLEAGAHLQKGLRLLRTLPESEQRWETEFNFQIILGAALTATEGSAAPKTGMVYQRASELSEKFFDPPQLISAKYGSWNFLQMGEETRAALEFAENFLKQAKETQNRPGLVTAHSMMGQSLFVFGDYALARSHTAESLDRWDDDFEQALGTAYPEHPGICSLAIQAILDWLIGLSGSRPGGESAGGLPGTRAITCHLPRTRLVVLGDSSGIPR